MISARQQRIQNAQAEREKARKRQGLRDYARAFMSDLRETRKAAGLCVRCAQPARPGKSECATCAAQSVQRAQASRARQFPQPLAAIASQTRQRRRALHCKARHVADH